MQTFSRPPRYEVLVGHDLEDGSELVLTAAGQLVTSGQATMLHLAHAVPFAPDVRDGLSALVDPSRDLTQRVAKALSLLERTADWLGPLLKVPVKAHLIVGPPDDVLVGLAGDLKVDLLVIGTHARNRVTRALLGSVAQSVIHRAPCPVLVVRPLVNVPSREPRIEPPCPQCLEARRASGGERFWCSRHSEHHPRAHTYWQTPDSFGVGSQLVRPQEP